MAKKNGIVEFRCISNGCTHTISFNLLELGEETELICPNCGKNYSFSTDLIEKLHKLNRLVDAIRDAEDILSNTNVAVNFKEQQIRIPYKLLLTRMNTVLTLNVGEKSLNFRFRVEPLNKGEQM